MSFPLPREHRKSEREWEEALDPVMERLRAGDTRGRSLDPAGARLLGSKVDRCPSSGGFPREASAILSE
jgi:hypothetical protein